MLIESAGIRVILLITICPCIEDDHPGKVQKNEDSLNELGSTSTDLATRDPFSVFSGQQDFMRIDKIETVDSRVCLGHVLSSFVLEVSHLLKTVLETAGRF